VIAHLKVLIKAGADIHSKDNQGNTPLHLASANKRKNCMDLLLEAGGRLDEKNNDGMSALDLADRSFAALYELQRVNQSKTNAPTLKHLKFPVRKEGEENKSTHMESANSVSKSIFTARTVGPKDFKVHCLIGTGSFGDVYLVEKKDNKQLYALKVLLKENVFSKSIANTEHALERYAITEKNVLAQINHPFIVKLHYAFQNAERLFMVIDFCPGGDLGERLHQDGTFTEERSKMYLAEVILALEELHSRDIIYRDLKPDNILIDQEGHALLTDFGLSKEDVSEFFTGAKSFCGSVAYLAPEMLKRAGHGKAVDWYLVGVVLYEMLTGYPPYYAESKEELFKNIESAPLVLPAHASREAQSLLRQVNFDLLSCSSETRPRDWEEFKGR
jgi:serine/threonine protein kinase